MPPTAPIPRHPSAAVSHALLPPSPLSRASPRVSQVNFPPFLFEADLFAAIDDSASSATIGKGTVEFKLVKREQVTWGRLSASLEKSDLQERRLEGQERSFKAQADAVDKKKEDHRLMQKAAVQKQIDQVCHSPIAIYTTRQDRGARSQPPWAAYNNNPRALCQPDHRMN